MGNLRQRAGRTARRAGVKLAGIGLLVGLCASSSSTSGGPSSQMLLVGYGSSGPTQTAPGASQSPGAGADHAVTTEFKISGGLTGLYPGVTLPLVLTVTNPFTVTITVTSITTAIGNATTTCLAANLKVTSFVGKLAVAAGKTAKTTVHVTMAHTAPNACQGKIFPLKYSGLATGA